MLVRNLAIKECKKEITVTEMKRKIRQALELLESLIIKS
jgi:hypothetical protein